MKIVQAILDAWPLALLVGYAVLNLLNALTPHYSQLSGITGWLAAVLERLSVMTSRKADLPLKLPLTSAPPNKQITLWRKPPTAIIPLIVAASLMVGCASVNTQAERAFYATKAASAIVEPAFHSRCDQIAVECHQAGDRICEELATCQNERRLVVAALDSANIAIETAVLLAQIKKSAPAQQKIDEALRAIEEAYNLMVKYNVVAEVTK